jgi:hypothetical protein
VAVLYKRLSCIVMDGQTNVGYMLIPKCFTLDGNGVLGLEVRERLEREDEKLCVC